MNRELPSLFCHTCLRWIVTRDKYNGLARLNGKLTLVTIWTPECSKEAYMIHTCADKITAPNGSVFLPDLMTTCFDSLTTSGANGVV